MGHVGNIQIRTWMAKHLEEHRDPATDEVIMTTLAEGACQDLDGYVGDEIPERFYECAFQLYERDVRKRSGWLPTGLAGLVQSMDDSLR